MCAKVNAVLNQLLKDLFKHALLQELIIEQFLMRLEETNYLSIMLPSY